MSKSGKLINRKKLYIIQRYEDYYQKNNKGYYMKYLKLNNCYPE